MCGIVQSTNIMMPWCDMTIHNNHSSYLIGIDKNVGVINGFLLFAFPSQGLNFTLLPLNCDRQLIDQIPRPLLCVTAITEKLTVVCVCSIGSRLETVQHCIRVVGGSGVPVEVQFLFAMHATPIALMPQRFDFGIGDEGSCCFPISTTTIGSGAHWLQQFV